MEEVKLTKEQEILFEVYDKGVQNEDCDLDAYVEKMKQALTLTDVSQQRELLSDYNNFINNECVLAGGILTEFEIKKFQERNCG